MFGKINSFLLTSDFHLSDNNNTGNLTEIEKYEEMLNNIEYDDINRRKALGEFNSYTTNNIKSTSCKKRF